MDSEPLLIIPNSENAYMPPRPHGSFSREDSRYWYDEEHALKLIPRAPQPESPADGPEGKKIICNMPVSHPYQLAFQKGLKRIADLHDIQLEIYDSDWDTDSQFHFAGMAIKKNPDLIIHINPCPEETAGLYRTIYEQGLPVIASNMVPAKADLPYTLTWTGPDDWGMSRALARAFAEIMDFEGAYTLIQHYPGSSCEVARTWGIITELKAIAPQMTCLDYAFTGMNEEKSRSQTRKWIKEYGPKLKGIVSPDSHLVQRGINKARGDLNRQDIVCVSHGSPAMALDLIKHGFLHASTYQSGIIDGIMSMQAAVDWFNGFEIPQVRYMPVHVITPRDVNLFINRKNELPLTDYTDYVVALKMEDGLGISEYFESLRKKLREYSLVTEDYCRGMAIELVSHLMSTIAEKGFCRDNIRGLGSPAMLANYLFNQKSFSRTLAWLEQTSLEICTSQRKELTAKTSIEQVVEYININFNEPISLKTLSYQFDLTAAYLGQIFRCHTGKSFSVYLNEIRVNQAKNLLMNRNIREYEIAREVGYADAGYFYKIFKKQTGMNPSQYREKYGPPSASSAAAPGEDAL